MHNTLEKKVTLKTKQLSPLLKWPGGKEREIKDITPYLPLNIDRYFEPFVGGGAVYFSINANKYYINDKLTDLVDLYKNIKSQNLNFFDPLNKFNDSWILISKYVDNEFKQFENYYKIFKKTNSVKYFEKNIFNADRNFLNSLVETNFNQDIQTYEKTLKKIFYDKIYRIYKLENDKGDLSREDILKNLECALKSGLYTYLRYLFNFANELNIDSDTYNVLFLFLRNYSYSSMFRYNADGQFNVPYGGIDYNRKFLTNKIEYYASLEIKEHLSKTEIYNLDFEDFLYLNGPKEKDFIFLDPPYDTTFNTYAKNSFDKADQERLASYLILKCKAKWLLVIKNTDFIYGLYNKPGINIANFDKKYTVSFKNRNDKNVNHLIIKNYEL